MHEVLSMYILQIDPLTSNSTYNGVLKKSLKTPHV